ncbi:MAG: hypothetical protein NVS3B1_23590 [Marmoricola sp.]
MPELFNVDHQPAAIDHDQPAVMPGASHDFTDEQVTAGLSGSWSTLDPRSGLSAEEIFKRRRDASRGDLDDEARSLGVTDPDELPNKQAVIEAIHGALESAQASIEDVSGDLPADSQDPDPAESGDNEE